MSLPPLEGTWGLTRAVVHAGRGRVRASGRAEFTRDGEGLLEREWGRAIFADGGSARFEQRRLWRVEGGILVLRKGDGTLLCALDGGGGVHECPPDTYRLHLDLGRLPGLWVARWRVTGPRKEYRMRSEYRRG